MLPLHDSILRVVPNDWKVPEPLGDGMVADMQAPKSISIAVAAKALNITPRQLRQLDDLVRPDTTTQGRRYTKSHMMVAAIFGKLLTKGISYHDAAECVKLFIKITKWPDDRRFYDQIVQINLIVGSQNDQWSICLSSEENSLNVAIRVDFMVAIIDLRPLYAFCRQVVS